MKEGKKNSYFEVYIRTETEEFRVVSFDSDAEPQFRRRLHLGVALSNVTKSGDDFLYTDRSSLCEKSPTFKMPLVFNIPSTPLKNVIENKPLYSRVTLEVKVTHLDPPGISKDSLPFRVTSVIDNSINEPRQLTLYGQLIDKVSVSNAYNLSYITVSKYGGKRVLKTSERTIVTTIENDVIKVPEKITEVMKGRIVSVMVSSLDIKYTCPHCKSLLDVEGSIMVLCEHCDTALSLATLQSTSFVQFTVSDNNHQLRHTFLCEHQIVENLVAGPLTNKQAVLSRLIDMKAVLTYEKGTNKVVSVIKDEVDLGGKNED